MLIPRIIKSPAVGSDTPRDTALEGFVWLPFCFAAVIIVLAVMGEGSAARYLYPLAAAGISLFLYLRAPVTYVKFVWWLWFLSPFVRRIVDFRSGWTEPNPILAAPLLATLACLPCLYRERAFWQRRTVIPFSLAFLCVSYGFCVGCLFLPLSALLISAMGWIAPLAFGLFMYSEYGNSQHGLAQTEALHKTFTWGLLVIGAYGVIQFIVAPGWDVMWMVETDSPVFGAPEPFGIRVFSTMNSPVPFAVGLSVALLLMMRQRQTLFIVAASLSGYASLLLSSVRSAWAGWVIGVFVLLGRQKQNRGRILLGALLITACSVGALAIKPVRDIVQTRLSTLTDIRNDDSYQDRASGYQQMFSYLSDIPFGLGLGSMDAKFSGKLQAGPQVVTNIGARDSGIIEILFCLGWVAGTVYLFALLLLAFFLLQGRTSQTTLAITTSSISVAVMTQLFLGSATVGFPGVLLWGFAGIALGSRTPSSEKSEFYDESRPGKAVLRESHQFIYAKRNKSASF